MAERVSREREFLKKLRYASLLENDLRKELEELLAQPEQEQEPVAWIYEWVDEAGEPVKSVAYNFYDDANPIPLYTAPPKRELLGDGITADMYRANKKATHPDSYWAGVYDAEKAHGIGVDNESI